MLQLNIQWLNIYELISTKLKKDFKLQALPRLSLHNEAFETITQSIFPLKRDQKMNLTLQTHIII